MLVNGEVLNRPAHHQLPPTSFIRSPHDILDIFLADRNLVVEERALHSFFKY